MPLNESFTGPPFYFVIIDIFPQRLLCSDEITFSDRKCGGKKFLAS